MTTQVPDLPDRPLVAGIYDCFLGGTDHTPADRAAANRALAVVPDVEFAAWANRGFLQRVVTRMVREWGIRQIIDIGAGLPTQRNSHQVATEIDPDVRVIYVDNEPRVIERARRMLDGVKGVAFILGDLRDPDAVLGHPETRRLIDFREPVGLLLIAVTHFVPTAEDPWGITARYLDALAPGSYLALSAVTDDFQAPRLVRPLEDVYNTTSTPVCQRTRAEVARHFDGLEIVPPFPGAPREVAYVGLWGAEDPVAADDDGSRWVYAGVARKP